MSRSRSSSPKKTITEEEFYKFLEFALTSLNGVAISLAIIVHMKDFDKNNITHYRIYNANVRDSISVLTSLYRDDYRIITFFYIVKRIKSANHVTEKCFITDNFSEIAGIINKIEKNKPTDPLENMVKIRKSATAHYPEFAPDGESNSFNTSNLIEVYSYLKDILNACIKHLDPTFASDQDEERIMEAVRIALTIAIIKVPKSFSNDST